MSKLNTLIIPIEHIIPFNRHYFNFLILIITYLIRKQLVFLISMIRDRENDYYIKSIG